MTNREILQALARKKALELKSLESELFNIETMRLPMLSKIERATEKLKEIRLTPDDDEASIINFMG